jgi:hypothetical protein
MLVVSKLLVNSKELPTPGFIVTEILDKSWREFPKVVNDDAGVSGELDIPINVGVLDVIAAFALVV